MKTAWITLALLFTTFLLAATQQGSDASGLSASLNVYPDSMQQTVIKAEKAPNADLFFNLGVDFFSLGDVGHANLYFLKALNINSAHKQARANLDTSMRLGQDSKLYPQRLFLVRVLYQFSDFLSVPRLAMFALIFLLLSALALAWLLFYDPEKELALPILTLSFVSLLCLCSFIALGIKSYRQSHNPLAVVITPRCELFSAASAPIMELHAGLIVHIIEAKTDFITVRLPNGETGKIETKHLKRVTD